MSKLFLVVPLAPQAKARPRVTRNGTYMPKAYQAWRSEFVGWVNSQQWAEVKGLFAVEFRFITKSGAMRPDLDNAAGACLDALQDAGVIDNDSACRRLVAEVAKGKGYRIEIEITEVAA
jgi:Holliday junction resolvase RusA-like endonuclease